VHLSEEELGKLEQQLKDDMGVSGSPKWKAFAAELTLEMQSNPLQPFFYDKSIDCLGEEVLSFLYK
jgi:hypothetical protein